MHILYLNFSKTQAIFKTILDEQVYKYKQELGQLEIFLLWARRVQSITQVNHITLNEDIWKIWGVMNGA